MGSPEFFSAPLAPPQALQGNHELAWVRVEIAKVPLNSPGAYLALLSSAIWKFLGAPEALYAHQEEEGWCPLTNKKVVPTNEQKSGAH